jgi:hypothetical protein
MLIKNKSIFYYFVFLLIILIFIFSSKDIKNGSDLTKYLIWQSNLDFRNIIDFFPYIFSNRFDGPFFFVSVIIYKIIYSLDFLFNWEKLFIFFNFFLIFFTFYLLSKILVIKEIIRLSLLAILFWFNLEYSLWVNYTLTDIFFSTLTLVFLYFLINEKKILSFFIFLIIFLTRSTSFAVLFFLLQYIFFKILKRNLKLTYVFIILLISNLLLLLACSYFIFYFDSSNVVIDSKINYFNDKLTRGIIIDDRPETYINGTVNLLFFFKVMFLRFFYFFNFYADGYSFSHKIYNILYFSFLYLGILINSLYIKLYSKKVKEIIFLMILFILSFAVFHSIYLIDYDWRYRVPTYGPMIYLSFLGYSKILQKIFYKIN